MNSSNHEGTSGEGSTQDGGSDAKQAGAEGRSYGSAEADGSGGMGTSPDSLSPSEAEHMSSDTPPQETGRSYGAEAGHGAADPTDAGLFGAGMGNVRLNYILGAVGILFGPLVLVAGAFAFFNGGKGTGVVQSHYVWQQRSIAVLVIVSLIAMAVLQSWAAWIVTALVLGWYLLRMWKGWQAQSGSRPIENPQSWLL